MMLVLGGSGPSSKVITTSWSFSGSVCLYCMVPSRVNSPGLMVSTRLVPRASGLPGHVSAEAAMDPPARMQTHHTTIKRTERLALNYLAHISQVPHEVRWTLVQHQRFSGNVTEGLFIGLTCFSLQAFGATLL